jgi:hypothetical protein
MRRPAPDPCAKISHETGVVAAGVNGVAVQTGCHNQLAGSGILPDRSAVDEPARVFDPSSQWRLCSKG